MLSHHAQRARCLEHSPLSPRHPEEGWRGAFGHAMACPGTYPIGYDSPTSARRTGACAPNSGIPEKNPSAIPTNDNSSTAEATPVGSCDSVKDRVDETVSDKNLCGGRRWTLADIGALAHESRWKGVSPRFDAK
jgi:hypothetical protein